jgi:hypothetical protein
MCNTSQLVQELDTLRHLSPFAFSTRTSLKSSFSHFSLYDSTYNCLSGTITIITGLIKMSCEHPKPYHHDTPIEPAQQTRQEHNQMHHVPLLKHYPQLMSRANPHTALLCGNARLHDNIITNHQHTTFF